MTCKGLTALCNMNYNNVKEEFMKTAIQDPDYIARHVDTSDVGQDEDGYIYGCDEDVSLWSPSILISFKLLYPILKLTGGQADIMFIRDVTNIMAIKSLFPVRLYNPVPWISVNDSVLNMETREYRVRTKDDCMSYVYRFRYDPYASSEIVNKFMEELYCPEVSNYIKEYLTFKKKYKTLFQPTYDSDCYCSTIDYIAFKLLEPFSRIVIRSIYPYETYFIVPYGIVKPNTMVSSGMREPRSVHANFTITQTKLIREMYNMIETEYDYTVSAFVNWTIKEK